MRRPQTDDGLVFEELSGDRASPTPDATANVPTKRTRSRQAAIVVAAFAVVGGAVALAAQTGPSRRFDRQPTGVGQEATAAPASTGFVTAPSTSPPTSTPTIRVDTTIATFRVGTDVALWPNTHSWKLYVAERVATQTANEWRTSAVDLATLDTETVASSSAPERFVLTPFGPRSVAEPAVPGDGGAAWSVEGNDLQLLVADERRWSIARTVPNVMAVAGVASDHAPIVKLLDGRWYRFDPQTATFTAFADGHVVGVAKDSYVNVVCSSPEVCVTTAHGPQGRSVHIGVEASVVSLSPDGRWVLVASATTTTITNLVDQTVASFAVGVEGGVGVGVGVSDETAPAPSGRPAIELLDPYGVVAWTPDSSGVFVVLSDGQMAVVDVADERLTQVEIGPNSAIIAVG